MSMKVRAFEFSAPEVSQVRIVALDEKDNIEAVIWQSEEFNPPVYSFNKEWYEGLKYAMSKYDLTDYDNIPALEFQILVKGEWRFFSSVVEDFYNL